MGDGMCGEGGVSAGIVRLGCQPVGMDLEYMERYVAKFGEHAFVRGSVLSGRLQERLGGVHIMWASPPCKAGSSMAHAGGGLTESAAPQLIPGTRQVLEALGVPYIIENVMGSAAEGVIRADVTLRNLDFGLHANRPRCFESNRPLQNEFDTRRLTQRCCLGCNNRMPRLDWAGRRLRDTHWPEHCCGANIEAIYSRPGKYSSVENWERAQGVDPGHMSVAGLAQSIAPDKATYLVGQLVARLCHEKWGVPLYTFEQGQTPEAKAVLHRYLHGQEEDATGGRAAESRGGTANVAPHPALSGGESEGGSDGQSVGEHGSRSVGAALPSLLSEDDSDCSGAETELEELGGSDTEVKGRASPRRRGGRLVRQRQEQTARALARQKAVRLSDHELSRLYNSADGNFDQVVSRPGAAPYLERRTRTEAVGVAGAAQVWTGKHTWVQVERAELEAAVISFRRAYEALAPGAARCTAASVLLDVRSRGPEADYVRKHGRLLGRWNDRGTLLGKEEMTADGVAVYQLGRAGFDLPSSVGLSDEQIEAALDETDERTVPISAEEKKALSYSYMEVRPDAWRERGYPEHHELMSKGAVTQMSEPIPARLHLPNYAEKQKGDNWCIAEEMVRSEARGAIRWAEEEEAHFIHPWVVVHTEPEGKPKVRACGDYSAILNKHDTASWPFSMPRV